MRQDVDLTLPVVGDRTGRSPVADHIAEAVVEPHLIVEIVEARIDVCVVFVRLIYLTNEVDFRTACFHLADGISPELWGYHLSHVATEGINAF